MKNPGLPFWIWLAISNLALSVSVLGNSLIWELNYYDPGIFFVLAVPHLAFSFFVLVSPLLLLCAWVALRKKSGAWIGIPFAFTCIAVLPVFFGTPNWWLHHNEWWYGSGRMEFLQKVLADPPKTSSENFYNNRIAYPEGQHLSIGDSPAYFKLTENGPLLLFLTFEGIPDGFSGFLYSSTDIDPKKEWPELDLEWAESWDDTRHVYFVGNR